ncbi:MAG: hypothetical protein JO307_24370 [Bryobacterales bacterium]|nr:hypothetical protein [Bryobacterales bacterium]
MYDVVGQAASLRRVANPPVDCFKKPGQRRLATGAQDSILPHYGETE